MTAFGERAVWRLLLLAGLASAPLHSITAQRPGAFGAGPQLFEGNHRYRGTLGGQRVTVELSIGQEGYDPDAPVSATGTCRFEDNPTQLHRLRSWQVVSASRPLQLLEADSTASATRLGHWRAEGPPGPVLRGTWAGLTGETRPFELREDYRAADGFLAAVPYEVVGEEVIKIDSLFLWFPEWKARCVGPKANPKAHCDPRATLGRHFLHFIGPDSLRPALAALQCPPPAERRAQTMAAMREMVGEPAADRESTSSTPLEDSESIGVSFNGHGLLSWGSFSYYYSGGAHGGHRIEHQVYDLNTGEFLSISDLLRPGAERVLCHLLTRHLATEQSFPADALRQTADYPGVTFAPLPASGFGLEEKGLVFQYGDYEIGGYADAINPMTIPWAELLPLLSPDSVVARMLRERGLWRAAN
ncbi:RsiV family protein [Hymenobacter monticola]|uniref:DUF3298 and DUF4163 domain-containing protein n=1 Tax=Hymenobacter monticola TaxID=1705399 RepID=A0ABY4B785_9BACT|nr:RsiV family protein [Hymenobacter monticola]UOE32560.1 DUF3298 and DUF4163 domain-containing protein [Hymenobacter monticola]